MYIKMILLAVHVFILFLRCSNYNSIFFYFLKTFTNLVLRRFTRSPKRKSLRIIEVGQTFYKPYDIPPRFKSFFSVQITRRLG